MIFCIQPFLPEPDGVWQPLARSYRRVLPLAHIWLDGIWLSRYTRGCPHSVDTEEDCAISSRFRCVLPNVLDMSLYYLFRTNLAFGRKNFQKKPQTSETGFLPQFTPYYTFRTDLLFEPEFFPKNTKSREQTHHAFAPGKILGIINTCTLWHLEVTSPTTKIL